ncbi:MAG: glycosyltransferase family 2 protein [Magnetococcales bacterium]|nr:glycosyltransferase family 2 protein [Magnetococcales bacterium]
MTTAPLSIVLITKNAGHLLAPCLESVDFADEVVLVDSGSEDNTLEIAWKYNARTIHQPWLGFGPQKQFAVERAKHDWVLCLDADERVSSELKISILEILKTTPCKAYEFPRRNRFLGRWLKHGEGYPDYNLRLFHRDHARWSSDPIHEKVITREPVGRLVGDLLHESEQTIADYLNKQNIYTSLQAEALYASGRVASPWRMVSSPVLRFIKFYLLRLGFLDGVPGLIHIAIGSCNSFFKYAKLYAKHRTKPQPARDT